MGEKIDEALFRLWIEAEHHTKLAQSRDDTFESGFAQGFAEAVRIVEEIRGGHPYPRESSTPAP